MTYEEGVSLERPFITACKYNKIDLTTDILNPKFLNPYASNLDSL